MELSIINATRLWKTDDEICQKSQKNRINNDLNVKRWNNLDNLTILLFILLQLSLTYTTTIQAVPADRRNIVVAATIENYTTKNGTQTLQRMLRDVAAKNFSFNVNSGREATNNNNNNNNNNTNNNKNVLTEMEKGIRGREGIITDIGGSSAIVQNPATELTFDQPQGQCLLDGVYVPETTVFCEKQVGCRAIQKTGHCCPDYKCDCQKDGKTYANGDKLVDPGTPCTVCYCQGGEILCSSVTCFHRDDCTPKFIPGVCCPEYDNCPVSITSEIAINATFSATTTTTTIKPVISKDNFNQKITIKEITKPIEIRITDDNKVIPIPQMILKPTFTTNANHEANTAASLSSTTIFNKITPAAAPAIMLTAMSTLTPTSTPASTQRAILKSSTTISTFSTNFNNNKQINEDANNDVSIKLTSLSIDNNQNHKPNAYTTHNINSRSNSYGENSENGENDENGESLKLTASVAYATNILDTNYSIMDKNVSMLDIINKNAKRNNDYMDDHELTLSSPSLSSSSSSTSSEPSLSVFNNHLPSHDPNKVNIKREYLINRENNSNKNVTRKTNNKNMHIDVSTISDNDDDEENENASTNSKTQGHSYTDSIMDAEFDINDSDTAGSDNIYHIVLTTVATTTTNNLMEISSITNDLNLNQTNDDHYNSSLILNMNPSIDLNISMTDNIRQQMQQMSHQQQQHHHYHNHSDDDEGNLILTESNPAYPSLPEDDFSLRDINFQLNEFDDTSDEILSSSSSVLVSQNNSDKVKSTKTVPDLDHNDDHHYDGGSGIIMDDLMALSSTTTTTTAAASSAAITTEGLNESEMNGQNKNFIKKENRKLPAITTTTAATTTTKAKVEFLNSAENSSSEETIISTMDIINENQLYRNNDTIKVPSSADSKEINISLENDSNENQNDKDDVIITNKNEKDKHKETITSKSIQSNKDNLDVDKTIAVASGDGSNIVPALTNNSTWNTEKNQ